GEGLRSVSTQFPVKTVDCLRKRRCLDTFLTALFAGIHRNSCGGCDARACSADLPVGVAGQKPGATSLPRSSPSYGGAKRTGLGQAAEAREERSLIRPLRLR